MAASIPVRAAPQRRVPARPGIRPQWDDHLPYPRWPDHGSVGGLRRPLRDRRVLVL